MDVMEHFACPGISKKRTAARGGGATARNRVVVHRPLWKRLASASWLRSSTGKPKEVVSMFPRHLKTLIVLASAVVLALPVVASAQTARVVGLGVQGDYIKDYTNIFPYPGTLPTVGNLVIGELGVDNLILGVDHRAVG